MSYIPYATYVPKTPTFFLLLFSHTHLHACTPQNERMDHLTLPKTCFQQRKDYARRSPNISIGNLGNLSSSNSEPLAVLFFPESSFANRRRISRKQQCTSLIFIYRSILLSIVLSIQAPRYEYLPPYLTGVCVRCMLQGASDEGIPCVGLVWEKS